MSNEARWLVAGLLLAGLLAACNSADEETLGAAGMSPRAQIGVNVLLNVDPTFDALAQLGAFGRVNDVMPQIDAVTMRIRAGDLDALRALAIVSAANPDVEVLGAPVDTVSVEDFAGGLNTWDQDAVNVTDFGSGRVEQLMGEGVYVAVLDTGLLDTWRQYFPEERIAEEYARSFGGGGGERGTVSDQPNKWQHDTNSHGTHVTSTILGYSLRGTAINGVAPLATVIPVKVLNQNGSGWASVVARGVLHVAELKAGPLAASSVVINMSLGGPQPDAVLQAAIDEAIAQGVIVVASAGNEGEAGMGYPGAYPPVISAAASGWIGEWDPAIPNNNWWLLGDVPDPTAAEDHYITDFSSRELAGQDLDVAAPGSWVVGPFQLQNGKTSYFFLGGTSMASPHVAGIVALMAQKDPSLQAAEAEAALEASALPLPAGCRTIFVPVGGGATQQICWGDDASGSGIVTADAALAQVP